ncbi:MAG: hypothetical protein KAS32_14740 [Candidatus Peribacteraceae bacterium]|nr:hypothetical protein [Candidatus Peribacteraceae bacterium]
MNDKKENNLHEDTVGALLDSVDIFHSMKAELDLLKKENKMLNQWIKYLNEENER